MVMNMIYTTNISTGINAKIIIYRMTNIFMYNTR